MRVHPPTVCAVASFALAYQSGRSKSALTEFRRFLPCAVLPGDRAAAYPFVKRPPLAVRPIAAISVVLGGLNFGLFSTAGLGWGACRSSHIESPRLSPFAGLAAARGEAVGMTSAGVVTHRRRGRVGGGPA